MTKRDGSSQLGSCRKQVQVKKKKKVILSGLETYQVI